jgi:flagellar motility protein MotE (MotC chaperone)
MKRMIVAVQILIAIVILVKAASVFGVLQKINIPADAAVLIRSALAQSKMPSVKPSSDTAVSKQAASSVDVLPASKDAMDDMLAQQRDLATALTARKAELDNRENALRADEQRLIAMRKDIMEKMAVLKAQEEKLAVQLDAVREEDIKRYKDMAKVYDATPPAKAGPMMEKLDTKTAAGITMNMKKDKAGALWAYLSPQKAVDITREITRSKGDKAQ